MCGIMPCLVVQLSTSHGALGTDVVRVEISDPEFFQLHTVHQEPFNHFWKTQAQSSLSTPHGALGTNSAVRSYQSHKNHQAFNSTRCIRNNEKNGCSTKTHPLRLSTPHGALGTEWRQGWLESLSKASFQLHTVHQEQVMLAVVWVWVVWVLSTPHGALGTKKWKTERSRV